MADVESAVRYQCPECEECEEILEEGERRCEDCNKFGRKVEGFLCPHCGDFIPNEDIP